MCDGSSCGYTYKISMYPPSQTTKDLIKNAIKSAINDLQKISLDDIDIVKGQIYAISDMICALQDVS